MTLRLDWRLICVLFGFISHQHCFCEISLPLCECCKHFIWIWPVIELRFGLSWLLTWLVNFIPKQIRRNSTSCFSSLRKRVIWVISWRQTSNLFLLQATNSTKCQNVNKRLFLSSAPQAQVVSSMSVGGKGAFLNRLLSQGTWTLPSTPCSRTPQSTPRTRTPRWASVLSPLFGPVHVPSVIIRFNRYSH